MQINYTPPPTCREFMLSDKFLRIIAGPVGSGKTTSCLFELFRRSSEQAPAQDGYRYTRWAILRQTLKQLKDTVLKDILNWFPGIASYKVSDQTVFINIGDIRSEWLLLPLEEPKDQQRLLSLQLTGAWISEGIEINSDVVASVAGRCGRYPSGTHGVASWFGIIMDTNMPSEGSSWHRLMDPQMGLTPPDWKVFFQPSGLAANAENLEWLVQNDYTLSLPLNDPRRLAQGRTYYERLSRNNNPDWIRRYVFAEFGNDPSGNPVFSETFSYPFHVKFRDPGTGKDGLSPVPGCPLIIGLDFGRDPCAAICQLDPSGRFLILGEIVVSNLSLEPMLQHYLRPFLARARYLGRPVVIIGDPAGVAKSSLYEVTSFDVLKANRFQALPAPTNHIEPRLAAVDAFLMKQRGGQPALIVDGDHCPTIAQAFNFGYRYAKTKLGDAKPLPDKNKFSHIMDAVQYAALAAHGGMSTLIAKQIQRPVPKTQQRVSSMGWT